MLNKDVEKKINKIYEDVFKKTFKRNKSTLLKGSKKEIIDELLRLSSSKEYKDFAKLFAKQLSKKSLSRYRGVWKKYFNAAKQKHIIALPDTYRDFELDIFKKAVIHNFKMIKSIPKRIMTVYEQKFVTSILEQVAQGKIGRGSFEKELKTHGSTHAKLIARTETAKLQTSILENRARNLGSVAYIWRASNDKRTRLSHKEMNDVVVFWRQDSEKPLRDNMRGDAGEFPNCRCTPQPIFDETDLTKSTYKVYDYRNDSFITLRKIDLLEAIKNENLT